MVSSVLAGINASSLIEVLMPENAAATATAAGFKSGSWVAPCRYTWPA
jgi:hypothetical protein